MKLRASTKLKAIFQNVIKCIFIVFNDFLKFTGGTHLETQDHSSSVSIIFLKCSGISDILPPALAPVILPCLRNKHIVFDI
jgi:hypothetical protein